MNITDSLESFREKYSNWEINSFDTFREFAKEWRRILVKLKFLSSDDGSMFMDSESHGRGFGAELLEEFEDEFQQRVARLKATSSLGRPTV